MISPFCIRPFSCLLSGLLLAFSLLCPADGAFAAVFDVPVDVSQGHAFPVTVSDDRPFEAVFRWRGEDLRVKAAKAGKAGTWKAEILLAIPLDAVKAQPLAVTLHGQKQTFQIRPLSVKWPQSVLKVAPRYVEPPKAVRDRIAREQAKSRKALATRSPKKWELPLARPVPGGITSAFGGRRVFNGQPRAPHKGTDMRCSEGTPVKAAASGRVLLADDTYFGGKMVYVDHGQGVVSTYAHLSSFDVKAGDSVRKGQAIGRSGATGRVTGPHLHFGFLVQGVAVDAMPLLKSPPALRGGPSRTLYETTPKKKARSAR